MSDQTISIELSQAREKLDLLREWAARGSREFRIERVGDFPRAALVAYQEAVVAELEAKCKPGPARKKRATVDEEVV
jgi:hypothetical protein